MKLKGRFFYSLLALIVIFESCTEKDLITYDVTGGNSIYFTEPYNTANSSRPRDSVSAQFGFLADDVVSTVVSIPVKVTGPLVDYDREFSVQADPNGMLKEGTDFRFLNQPLVIPANTNDGVIQIEVFKSEVMKETRMITNLDLVPNTYFNTQIKTRKSSLTLREVPVLRTRLIADDFNEIPYCWTNNPSRTTFNNYMGPYSKAKLDLIIELFDEDIEHFINPQYAMDYYFQADMVIFWASYMKFWLEKEASEGREHYDENGQLITLGPNAK